MWSFFNHRAFLKRWQLRKETNTSEHDLHDVFLRLDKKKRGFITRRNFISALKDLKFQINDFEELVLLEVIAYSIVY